MRLRLFPGLVLLALAGCSFELSTTIDQKMALKPRELKWVAASGTQRRQKLVVSVKAQGNAVDVGVVPDDELDKAKEAMKAGKAPPRSYHYSQGQPDAEPFEFVTDNNKGFAVLIRNPNEDLVEVHLTVKPK